MNAQPPNRLALLLHGNSGSARDMQPIGRALARKGFLVLNLDLPLHGKNKHFDPPLTIDSCAFYFRDVLARYQDHDVTIVGFSDGANVALRLLQLGLPRITQVVLLSPNSDIREIVFWWRLLFVISRGALATVSYLPVFRRIFRRIGMMTNYRLELSFPRLPKNITLLYAERDMISLRDQRRIADALGIVARVVPGTSHFSLLHRAARENFNPVSSTGGL